MNPLKSHKISNPLPEQLSTVALRFQVIEVHALKRVKQVAGRQLKRRRTVFVFLIMLVGLAVLRSAARTDRVIRWIRYLWLLPFRRAARPTRLRQCPGAVGHAALESVEEPVEVPNHGHGEEISVLAFPEEKHLPHELPAVNALEQTAIQRFLVAAVAEP